MSDVWIVYRDAGSYSDWSRDLLGACASREAAEALVAGFFAAWPTTALWNGWDDWSVDMDATRRTVAEVGAAGLSPWTTAPVEPARTAPHAPRPLERWVARPISSVLRYDEIEFYVERWAVRA